MRELTLGYSPCPNDTHIFHAMAHGCLDLPFRVSERLEDVETLNRLMMAQDTGGAIRGNVRADFFWGFGEEAGRQAGAMKQKGRMWALLPRDFPLSTTPLAASGGNGRSGLQ